MFLEQLGWNAHFAAGFAALGDGSLRPGRVIRQDSGRCLLMAADGEHAAILPRRGRGEADDPPVAGDWVAAEMLPGDWRVKAILPRASYLARETVGKRLAVQFVAANLDTALVVTDAGHDFNPRRIERYLIAVWNGGAQPVVVINKADEAPDIGDRKTELEALAPGLTVLTLSARSGAGVEALSPYLAGGRTVACVGSSGVGKSTLINRLLGENRQETGAVSDEDGKGRHTTTRRELLFLPGGAMIVDTPGLREIAPWYDGQTALAGFAEIDALIADCRFNDCSHGAEPGCAVRAALADGSLDPGRYESWRKLSREAAFQESRRWETAARERKRAERYFGRMVKDIKRRSPKS